MSPSVTDVICRACAKVNGPSGAGTPTLRFVLKRVNAEVLRQSTSTDKLFEGAELYKLNWRMLVAWLNHAQVANDSQNRWTTTVGVALRGHPCVESPTTGGHGGPPLQL